MERKDKEALARNAEKICNIGHEAMNMIIGGVDNLDLDDGQKFLALLAIVRALKRSVEEDVGDKDDIMKCYQKTVDRSIGRLIDHMKNLRSDLKTVRIVDMIIEDMERHMEERMENSSRILYDLCKNGKAKEYLEFQDKVIKMVVQESNRLGRYLTEDEIFEICRDVCENRK